MPIAAMALGVLVSPGTASPAAATGPLPAVTNTLPPGMGYVSVSHWRVLDTRDGTGAAQGRVPARSVLTVAMLGGERLPTPEIAAVVVNVTAVQPDVDGFVTVYPAGSPAPLASNLNFRRGETVANQVIVALGSEGKIALTSNATTDLLVDITGYFTKTSTLTTLTPTRLIDTRSTKTPNPAAGVLKVPVSGRAGIPGGATSAIVNVTVVDPKAPGFATVYPSGTDRPVVSNSNYVPGQTIAALSIPKIGTDGTISIYTQESAHIVVDVVGWFSSTKDYTGFTPHRLVDTRGPEFNRPPLPAHQGTTFKVRGDGVPATAQAVLLNVTVTAPEYDGYAEAFVPGTPPGPGISTVNYSKGQTIANSVIIRIGAKESVSVYSSAPAHVIVDITGYVNFPPVTGKASALATSEGHTCAIVEGGIVKCWGWDRDGQLGDGDAPATTLPTTVVGITGATQVATGSNTALDNFTCAIVAGGAVKCWGSNRWGQLGDGTTTSSPVPVQVQGLSGATRIAAGHAFACALLTEGTVKCWGNHNDGRLGHGEPTKPTGPVQVKDLKGATALGAGSAHACVLVADGKAKCWGANNYGALGDGSIKYSSNVPVDVSGLSGATAIAAGSSHTCTLDAQGSVKCWGAKLEKPLNDGTIPGTNVPMDVPGIASATQISSSGSAACVVVAGGVVKCWGQTYVVDLGGGSTGPGYGLVTVAGLGPATAVAGYSCAIETGGAVKCWGSNAGYGSAVPDADTPVYVYGL